MSRAFVREGDGEDDGLPDRPVSSHRNLVTPGGLAMLDRELAEARERLVRAGGDRPAAAAARRDIRYWTARRASAEVVEPAEDGTVRFGATVTIEREDGRRRTFRIVGEDEADPARGCIAHVAPLARAVLGRQAGDEVEFAGGALLIVG